MRPELERLVQVFINPSKMSASIYISSAPDASGISHAIELTADDLKEIIKANGINTGIDNAKLNAIVAEKQFDRHHTIATGKEPVNGESGYYTYYFKTEIDNKPVVQPDGSVDYHATCNYEPVSEGKLVAEYTPATKGFSGYTVCGELLNQTQGKDLSPIKGKGFTVKEGKYYFSEVNGKIEFKNNEIIISNVLDLDGDVDLTTGDILFDGDVIIKGNVLTGATIRAGGNLTVMGNVEGATVIASGDIVLKSGMQGGGKGKILCGGDLWGKFFEHTQITVDCDLHANSLMNCETLCKGEVLIHGRHGIIVGGVTKSYHSIHATVIGNMSEVHTELYAGINEETLAEIQQLEEGINEEQIKLNKHNVILEKLNQINNPTDAEKYAVMLTQVRKSMHEISNAIVTKQQALEQKIIMLETSSNSVISVDKYIYPGVIVVLNGIHYYSKSAFSGITLKTENGVVTRVSNI